MQEWGGRGEAHDSAGLLLRDLVCGGQCVDVWRAHISKRCPELVQVQILMLGTHGLGGVRRVLEISGGFR